MSLPLRRESAIDLLRFGMALCVIALHCSFPDLAAGALKQILVNGVYRLAVPVFSLISGYFFWHRLQAGQSGVYLRRILALYILWMVIYFPIYGPGLSSLGDGLHILAFGYFHLWFLPGLLISAVLIITLGTVRKIVVAAVVLAMIGLGLQYLVLSGSVALSLDSYRNGLFTLFPFFALGSLLAQNIGTWFGVHARVLMILALLALSGESLLWYQIAGGGFGVDMMISLFFVAPLLFLSAQQSQFPLSKICTSKRLANMSTFIYLIHVMMMICASRFGLSGNTKALVVMASCIILAAWLSQKKRAHVLAFFS